MRFLLDTNILIPLEDTRLVLQPSLSNFIKLARANSHEVLYHPASERDIARDADLERRKQTIARLALYKKLEGLPPCPWNMPETDPNDAVDNEILHAVEANAVHALVTEDRGIHAKAKLRGLEKRVYYIQTAEDWLKRLHAQAFVSLPNIRNIFMYQLDINAPFYESLRTAYPEFNIWFADSCRAGREAWVYGDDNINPDALCIYAVQNDQVITENKLFLAGKALKLCTFKVSENARGKKIGELFLKAAFKYATDNGISNIFITARPEEQNYLKVLLMDFGFQEVGTCKGDAVFLKSHPVTAPEGLSTEPFDYHRQYFPHFRKDAAVDKFLVPIKPAFHETLFPDFTSKQLGLFQSESTVGNAIKLAYLCHANTKQISKGDVLLFYRSHDYQVISSVGIVEDITVSSNAEEIAEIVSRRTVYNLPQIRHLAKKPTKVLLFRLVRHFAKPVDYNWLLQQSVIKGPPQSIQKIDDSSFEKIIAHAD